MKAAREPLGYNAWRAIQRRERYKAAIARERAANPQAYVARLLRGLACIKQLITAGRIRLPTRR